MFSFRDRGDEEWLCLFMRKVSKSVIGMYELGKVYILGFVVF